MKERYDTYQVMDELNLIIRVIISLWAYKVSYVRMDEIDDGCNNEGSNCLYVEYGFGTCTYEQDNQRGHYY